MKYEKRQFYEIVLEHEKLRTSYVALYKSLQAISTNQPAKLVMQERLEQEEGGQGDVSFIPEHWLCFFFIFNLVLLVFIILTYLFLTKQVIKLTFQNLMKP